MCDTEKSVDHDAINETIHAWIMLATISNNADFTTEYSLIEAIQARCDELDWQLEYQRRPRNEHDTREEYAARVRPPKIDGNGRRLRRIDRAANTLPLAICLAVVAAIEELKPEPEPVLFFAYGSDGYARRSLFNGEQDIFFARRCTDEDRGGDGICFCEAGSVHIANPDQIHEIARWLHVMADEMEQLKEG